jgi:CMP-N-acetylneuraminate monooxygenase
MKTKGHFKIVSDLIKNEINIQDLKLGPNSLSNHIVLVDENKNIQNVIDKVCDHAGGKLILKDDHAICPLHGWKLNLNTLKYQDSHICKKNVNYRIEDDKLILEDYKRYLINPFKKTMNGNEVKVRYLNHATVEVRYNGVSLITDPWLFGPAFMTGWWLDQPSAKDSLEILQNADYIYISHNHPDHLHPETLNLLDKNTKFIVGDFKEKSTEKYLISLGFTNVRAMDFNVIFEIEEDFQFSIFKSGDFRDDSGLYLCLGGMEILFTVDSNFLNSHVLPKNIDLLLTAFAGGASGFPLCFEDYDLSDKLKIIKRNKFSVRAIVIGYLNATLPKYYMPYAGMFDEKAKRDSFIREFNLKNSPLDYKDIVNNLGVIYLHPAKDIIYSFKSGKVNTKELSVDYLKDDDSELYIESLKNRFKYDSNKVLYYISNSGFIDKQIVYIIPTNDDFSKIVNAIIFCDFEQQIFKVVHESEIISELPDFRIMRLYVREEVFANIVENNLPWEDFSIGFQMRVFRTPNTYESEFWYHFTNVYINDIHHKFNSNCGACTIIDQNPILNKLF